MSAPYTFFSLRIFFSIYFWNKDLVLGRCLEKVGIFKTNFELNLIFFFHTASDSASCSPLQSEIVNLVCHFVVDFVLVAVDGIAKGLLNFPNRQQKLHKRNRRYGGNKYEEWRVLQRYYQNCKHKLLNHQKSEFYETSYAKIQGSLNPFAEGSRHACDKLANK